MGPEKLIDFKSVELENGSDALGEMGSQKMRWDLDVIFVHLLRTFMPLLDLVLPKISL